VCYYISTALTKLENIHKLLHVYFITYSRLRHTYRAPIPSLYSNLLRLRRLHNPCATGLIILLFITYFYLVCGPIIQVIKTRRLLAHIALTLAIYSASRVYSSMLPLCVVCGLPCTPAALRVRIETYKGYVCPEHYMSLQNGPSQTNSEKQQCNTALNLLNGAGNLTTTGNGE
jgi:hypothetical protein